MIKRVTHIMVLELIKIMGIKGMCVVLPGIIPGIHRVTALFYL